MAPHSFSFLALITKLQKHNFGIWWPFSIVMQNTAFLSRIKESNNKLIITMHNWFLYRSTGAQEFRYTVYTGIEGCLCMRVPSDYSKIAYPV